MKVARRRKWTARWSSAQGNNDPFSRRVRVLTNRLRPRGPRIREFEDREELTLFDLDR